jgi:hypothetical protein
MPRLLNDIVDSFLRLATDFRPEAVNLRAVDRVYRAGYLSIFVTAL